MLPGPVIKTQRFRGRTSWGRSAILLVPGVAAVGAIVVAMAQGAVAAQFGVADSNMKMGISELNGAQVTGYVGSDATVKAGKEPMVLLGVGSGTAKNLCLSTVIDVPIVGAVSLNVGAGGKVPADIDSLTANATELITPDGILNDAQLGRDGSTLNQNRLLRGPEGSWGLQAGSLAAKDVRLTAFNGGAAQLRLSGLTIQVKPGKHECF